MADEVEAPDYTDKINKLIDSVVFQAFKGTPEYEQTKTAVLTAANTSSDDIVQFVTTAITMKGVSEDNAFSCVELFILSKLQQQP